MDNDFIDKLNRAEEKLKQSVVELIELSGADGLERHYSQAHYGIKLVLRVKDVGLMKNETTTKVLCGIPLRYIWWLIGGLFGVAFSIIAVTGWKL